LTPLQRTRLSLFVIRQMRGNRDRLWNEIVAEVRLR